MNVVWLLLGMLVWLLKPEQGMSRKLVPKDDDGKPTNSKLSWEEYKLYAEFYKFCLDFGLKANVFFYGITGAILTLLYNPSSSQAETSRSIGAQLPPLVLLALLMTPFIIGIILAGAFIAGAFLWFLLVQQINRRLKPKELNIGVTPYLNFLTVLLFLFGCIFGFVSMFLYCIMKSQNIFFQAIQALDFL
ncbi:MAG: hypothetical protein LC778_21115 [Acidobacteria bacterium]|nr:hypothetical protein [Acidobacteriota bacterium]